MGRQTIIGTSGGAGSTLDIQDGAALARSNSEFEQARADGNAYSWSNLTYDPDGADTILDVHNTSTSLDLYIEDIYLSSDTASEIVIHTSSGITPTGTAVTGVNLLRSSTNTADATAIADETNNGQAAASYSGRVLSVRVEADTPIHLHIGGAIVIPYNYNIGADLITAATAANFTFIGYYK